MKHQLLIIDDNKMMRQFLAHLFGKKKQVAVASSAEEAIGWLETHDHPDAIIVDYNLEGISGFDLLERLKLSDAYQGIPIVVISGNGLSDNRIRCLQAGAADFVVKPFNPTELELKVDRLIQNSLSASEQL